MISEVEKTPFFFIIGRPRSGTTLLRTILDAHPNVSIPAECSFIIQLKSKYSKITFWTKEKIEEFYHDLVRTRFYKIHSYPSEVIYKELLKLQGPNSYNTFCKTVIANNNSIFPKQKLLLLGDKNPLYSIFFENIFPIFEEAKFIFLIRDYRDNYLSIVNARFEYPSIAYTTKRWKNSILHFEKHVKKDPDRFRIIRYEDFVNEPEKYISDMCQFLKIPYYPNLTNFHEYKEAFSKIYPKESLEYIHERLFRPINSDKVNVWRNKLSKRKVIIADWISGKYAEKYGYKREYSKINIFLIFLTFPGILMTYFLNLYRIIFTLPIWWQIRFFNNLHWINGSFLYKFYKRSK